MLQTYTCLELALLQIAQSKLMGGCVNKQSNQRKYISHPVPIQKLNHSHFVESSVQFPQPFKQLLLHHIQTNLKEDVSQNLQLNLKQTVEIKRKPTEQGSERKATLKSGIRSRRSVEGERLDQRVIKLMEKDALMAQIYLRVRQNLKRE